MNSSTRLLLACAAYLASACTSTAGSSTVASSSSSGDDGGASSSAPTACAYGATDVTNCYGNESSTVRDGCQDVPCDQATFDPNALSEGDCYAYTEYYGQRDVHETCDQWRASGGSSAGTGAAGSDDGGATATCTVNPAGGTSACDTCIQNNCASEYCACVSDSRADDAGVTGCAGYLYCIGKCLESTGNPTESSCESHCAASYSTADSKYGNAYLNCAAAQCATCG